MGGKAKKNMVGKASKAEIKEIQTKENKRSNANTKSDPPQPEVKQAKTNETTIPKEIRHVYI